MDAIRTVHHPKIVLTKLGNVFVSMVFLEISAMVARIVTSKKQDQPFAKVMWRSSWIVFNVTNQVQSFLACKCFVTGSKDVKCTTGEGKCNCKDNHQGDKCNTCKDKYHMDAATLECKGKNQIPIYIPFT